MAETRLRTPLPERLTSRRGAWISLGIVLAIMVVLFGVFGSAKAPALNDQAPAGSESSRVSELMQKFPNAEEQSVLVVASREDGAFSDADLDALKGLLPVLDGLSDAGSTGPMVSDDGQAALLVAPITVGETNSDTAQVIKEMRAALAGNTPDGVALHVTGGPAFGADVAASFEGADFTLLLVSVLVFGAGTNYALLLISRYREEMQTTDDHRRALATAWRATAPAILASNVTVVLALLTLVLAAIPGTHGLGISSAIGLLVALAAVGFLLPPLLAVCGRKVFWPFVPRPGETARQGGAWRRIASTVVRQPARTFRVAPLLGGGLTSAEGVVETPYGRASSAWRIDDDGMFLLEVEVPVSTTCTVVLPDGSESSVASGRHSFTARIAA